MASTRAVDVNVISRNGIATDNRIAALTIDKIVWVSKDADNVTRITYEKENDNHASYTPDRYLVLETFGDIITKANNSDFDNGLVQVTVTNVNNQTISPARAEIINRVKVNSMVPIYNDDGSVAGTKIVYGHWRETILEVEENLVTNTSSSQD